MALIEDHTTTSRASAAVLIIDGHAMVAEGLATALDAIDDIAVVGIARTLDEAMADIADTCPDVIVLDARLGDGDAAESIRALRLALPSVHVIVLGASADYQAVMLALEAGASGYLLKGQRLSELADAVRTVRAGGRALAAELVNTLVDRLSAPLSRRFHLTARELEILGRLADGASTAAVSEQLGLSVNTVRNHVQSAIRRLGAHSKLEAISIARREGLITATT
ncbi:MAG: response regulator transcription factor [Ilumatobacteraceae bacterium]|nr:response regulator transcription factor [Ilumatobacteraceae bacterium]